jgi:hypothetical protein
MKSHSRLAWHLLVVAAVSVLMAAPTGAAKKFKEKPRQGQAGLYLVNNEAEEAHGLVVLLSKKAVVVTEAKTGFAGPFQNIRGVGTKTLEFSNARPAIAPSTDDESGFNLVFRSYKPGLKIGSYYWTNAEGQRIGKKHSP